MTGISRKLPDTERARLKKILREIVPDAAGVIVRTAAEGASEDELRADVERLRASEARASPEKKAGSGGAPALLQGEPDMAIRVVRDIFNDDFASLVVQGDDAWSEISPVRRARSRPTSRRGCTRWTSEADVFAEHRIDEQLAKGMDRKVWLPSGGSLVIDRTEAMTVVDVNTGKFTGSGGTLEETVTATTSRPPRRSSASSGCATSAASSSSTSSTWCSSPTATSCCAASSSASAATGPSTRSPRSPRSAWSR